MAGRQATPDVFASAGSASSGRDDVALVVGGARKLLVDAIRRDGGTQPRAAMDGDLVTEYAEAMEAGATFPPVTVYYDGAVYWLADGFHRVMAVERLGWYEIPAEVRQGTRRDAVLASAGANATHGARRTNADKRRAVMALLEDDEWGRWSDREIGRRALVSNRFVSNLRAELLSVNGSQIEERRVERGGTEYTMKPGRAAPAPVPASQGPVYATLTELEIAIGEWLEAFDDPDAVLAELVDFESLAAHDLRENLAVAYRRADLLLAVKLFRRRMASTARALAPDRSGSSRDAGKDRPEQEEPGDDQPLVDGRLNRGADKSDWTFRIWTRLPWARLTTAAQRQALHEGAAMLETWAEQMREEAVAL